MKKKYKATSKIHYAIIKFDAMVSLANAYVYHDKHDRAVEAYVQSEILRNKAWNLIYDLYPKLKGVNLRYSRPDKEILVVNDFNK